LLHQRTKTVYTSADLGLTSVSPTSSSYPPVAFILTYGMISKALTLDGRTANMPSWVASLALPNDLLPIATLNAALGVIGKKPANLATVALTPQDYSTCVSGTGGGGGIDTTVCYNIQFCTIGNPFDATSIGPFCDALWNNGQFPNTHDPGNLDADGMAFYQCCCNVGISAYSGYCNNVQGSNC